MKLRDIVCNDKRAGKQTNQSVLEVQYQIGGRVTMTKTKLSCAAALVFLWCSIAMGQQVSMPRVRQ
jgi:hypothetical protein